MIEAIAIFLGKIHGYVKFTEVSVGILIEGNLYGSIKDGLHGMHIHKSGDLSSLLFNNDCKSVCDHFNPYNVNHGSPSNDITSRHVGDLGNISFSNGHSKFQFIDNIISLKGNKRNIIGRSLVIHEDKDDLGKSNNKSSKISGNSGTKIACAVIGYSKNMCQN